MNDGAILERDFLREIEAQISRLPMEDISYLSADQRTAHGRKLRTLLERAGERMDSLSRRRLMAEFLGLGPLEFLMEDEEVTEILVNSPESIWVEKRGELTRVGDCFCSEVSFRNALERLCEKSRSHITMERPTGQGAFDGFRVQVIGGEITRGSPAVCLRRHPENPWTLEILHDRGWCTDEELDVVASWITERKNFLVLGATGSGKTSVVNACLQKVAQNERVLILEDTQELATPNLVSQRLLTREDPQRVLPDVTLSDLVRQALRLRPDRLVIGEIRGGEAKDFLMALSTGHSGSFGTLHASHPHQGLIRLEMLIQMGAPHWNLHAIRRLIQLSLKGIMVVRRGDEGRRLLEGLYEISSLEETGFLVEQVL